MGKTAPHDYSVAFSDSQELQVSRERLLKARSVIESSIESSIGIEAHLNDLGEFSEDPNKKSSQLELQNLRSRMRSHIRALERLLEVSSGTSSLVHFSLFANMRAPFTSRDANFPIAFESYGLSQRRVGS